MTDTAGTCTPAVDFTNHYREALLAVRDTVTASGEVLGVGWMPSRGFELSQDLDEAIAMSSQGITSMTDEGHAYYSYYIPDDIQDTAENVTIYNNRSVDAARQEAATLQEAYSHGTSSGGRTPDEILAQVDKHQDIPTYGATFVATVGTEGLLTMTLDAATMDDNP